MHRRLTSIALVLGLWLGVAGCARTPPEQALRETLSGLQAAVEKRDAAAVEERLAEDFIGPEGLDRDGARRLAQVLFLRYRSTDATLGPLEIAMQDQDRHATVRFTAALTAGTGGFLPESGQVYEVETGWRLEGDEWQLVSAEWKPRL